MYLSLYFIIYLSKHTDDAKRQRESQEGGSELQLRLHRPSESHHWVFMEAYQQVYAKVRHLR